MLVHQTCSKLVPDSILEKGPYSGTVPYESALLVKRQKRIFKIPQSLNIFSLYRLWTAWFLQLIKEKKKMHLADPNSYFLIFLTLTVRKS